MIRKPIDFQGIMTLDNPVVDLVDQFLEEKEHDLAVAILHAFPFKELHIPNQNLLLHSAMEQIEKYDFLKKEQIDLAEYESIVNTINNSFWDYVELLEGTAKELFLQLEQMTLEQWHERLAPVVAMLKDILIHRMENAIWAVRRLDSQLFRFRQSLEEPGIKLYFLKLSKFWTSIMDSKLISTLLKNQEFLRNQYDKFMHRCEGFLKIQKQVEPLLNKFSSMRIFSSLDRTMQKQFIKLYELLKIWELNTNHKELPAKTVDTALKNVMSIDKATGLFKDYYRALKKALFERSLAIKSYSDMILSDRRERDFFEETVLGCQSETHLLGSTINHYRDFLLRTDPNPYVRTKLGFSEAPAGTEPAYARTLLNLSFDVEAMSRSFEQLQKSLKNASVMSKEEQDELEADVNDALHTLGQPLASHHTARKNAEYVLEKLSQIDELGSFDSHTIPYTGDTLARLLHADWRYHTSFGIPLYHQIYSIHSGLVNPLNDRQHTNRLAKFSQYLEKISEWVHTGKLQTHAHEIELDINDIKMYLQDFLGYVQRSLNDVQANTDRGNEIFNEIDQQLLEYRHLFGNFFYQLRQNESEGPSVRKQFLFVDQYFETVELKLYDFKLGHSETDKPLE